MNVAPVVLAPEGGRGSPFAYDGRYLVTRGTVDGAASLIRIDVRTDERVELVRVDTLTPATFPQPLLTANELWLFDGDTRIERYTMP